MSSEFSVHAPSANAVFYRTYSRRKSDGTRENFREAMGRAVADIAEVGKVSSDQEELMLKEALKQHTFPSGRAFWVAGSDWSAVPANYSGYYNCTSTDVCDLQAFSLMMDLAMMGSGTGAVLEESQIAKLPSVANKIKITKVIPLSKTTGGDDSSSLTAGKTPNELTLKVGDSRQGWVTAYYTLLTLAFTPQEIDSNEIKLTLDLSQVRPSGERLKGFGGTANPIKLEEMFRKICKLVSKACGRKLSSVEACLLIDEAASCVVAGNIRRSAGMRQFSSNDDAAIHAKEGLYTQDKDGNWKVDASKEALRMANHTICYHTKPDLDIVVESVRKQFYSGEGAIQFVPEAVARANADVFNKKERTRFIGLYCESGKESARQYIANVAAAKNIQITRRELDHRMARYGLNPCGEIIGKDFHCNLAEVHLNTIDPTDTDAQYKAFYAAGLQVASLLQHKFVHERYQYSREIDPIVGVSFTGLFDFFVHAFGADWLQWMMDGRPAEADNNYPEQERLYLEAWRVAARAAVYDYCSDQGLRVPNRITTVQPAGTKSLLTGASSGWHPPKAQRFIRRITFGKQDPLVSALRDWGYNVIPAPSARDDDGNLLDDVSDPRVHEVLVEIPTEVSWANLKGCDKFDLSQLSAKAQFGLYNQVQTYYTDHNTSATIEFREHEIEELATLIHDNMGNGYISAALLARFDANATFPRLPFEPISKETYDEMQTAAQAWRLPEDEALGFLGVLAKYDSADYELTTEASCTSAACIAKADQDDQKTN